MFFFSTNPFLLFIPHKKEALNVKLNKKQTNNKPTNKQKDVIFPGAGMFSGGAKKSTKETSESFQGQKVKLILF